MKKILITGAKGKIGKILVAGLKKYYELKFADLPQIDIREYSTLEKVASGQEMIIHLAWNAKTENFQTKTADPDNILMAKNVYEVALKQGVKRIIMASSIHADNFRSFKGIKLLNHNKEPQPKTPYGRSKVKIENLGKDYSGKGLETVCIRFGAVGYEKPEPIEEEGMAVWLSDNDCVSLIKKVVDAKKVPNGFSIIYGVSNNKTRIHDYSNAFNWIPKDDSSLN